MSEEPLTDEELAELEAEIRQMSVWALDEADVRRLQLHRRSLEQLRALRTEVVELRTRLATAEEGDEVEVTAGEAEKTGKLF
jgi:hypothetical protein